MSRREPAAAPASAAFDAIEVGLVLLDEEGQVVLWNAWMAKRSGVSPQKALGARLDDLFPELRGSRLLSLVASALERGAAGELRPAPGDSSIPILPSFRDSQGADHIDPLLTVTPLPGSPHCCLLQVLGVNGTSHHQVEPNDQADKLERLQTDLQQLAYVVSHDLRAPLRTVRQFVSFLEEDAGDALGEDARTSLGHIVGGVSKMDQLILDLLEYSRAGGSDEPAETVDLQVLLAKALENLADPIEESGGQVELTELPTVSGSFTHLLKLFQQLIGNAFKFRGEDAPRVRISCTQGVDAWEFRVSDNGIGIDPKHHGRIFDIFKKLHAGSKYEGTGIGLSICRRIAEQHGGCITVESERGAGSTFTVTLPHGELPEIKSDPD